MRNTGQVVRHFELVQRAAKRMARAAAQGKCEEAMDSWHDAIRNFTRGEALSRFDDLSNRKEIAASKKLKGARAAFSKFCKIVPRQRRTQRESNPPDPDRQSGTPTRET